MFDASRWLQEADGVVPGEPAGPDAARSPACCRGRREGTSQRLLAIPSRERLERVLRYLLDESEFLSPHGIRSVSRVHREHPYEIDVDGEIHRVDYAPGECTTGLFGGNSNWRGPVWFPINYLLLEALERYHHFYGDDLRVECPVGSGRMLNLQEVAWELERRLASLFLPDASGRRPCHGEDARFANDPHWKDLVLFHEYFHGDTGRGVGASHQTGWTALVLPLHRGPGAPAAARPAAAKAQGARPAGGEPAMSDVHRDRRAHRVARGRRPGRLRLRDHARRAHAALPRAAAGGHDAADRPHGAGQRPRCLGRGAEAGGRSFSPASATRRACSRPSTGRRWSRSPTSRGRRGPTAWRTEAGSSTSCSCPTGTRGGGAPLAADRTARCGAASRGAPVPLGPRLPRPAPREPGVPLRGRDVGAAGELAPVRRRAGSARALQRQLPRRAAVVSRLPLRGGAGARAGRRRGSGRAGRVPLGSGRGRRGAAARRRRGARRATATRRTASTACAARSAPAARRFATPPRARGRRLPRAARRRQDHRRRLSLVHRLGARHVHRPARTLPRHRPPGRRAVDPARVGRTSSPKACCPTASSTRATRPSTTRSTPRSGTSSRCTSTSRPPTPRAGPASARDRKALGRGGAGDPRGYVRGTRYGIRADGRRPARRRRAGRAAHLDGRQGGRLGGDAAHRQAGGDPGALAQRAPHRRAVHAELRGALRARAGERSRAASGTTATAASTTWWTPTTCPARLDPTLPAQPDLRRRRPALLRCSTARGPARSWTRSSGGSGRRSGCGRWHPATRRLHRRATRAAFARATARTTRARSGPGCSGRSSRPGSGCAATAADVRREARRRFLEPLLRAPRRRRAWATSRRSPTPSRRTRPRGCPFQAWSVGEALRLDLQVLATPGPGGKAAACAARRRLSRPMPATSCPRRDAALAGVR